MPGAPASSSERLGAPYPAVLAAKTYTRDPVTAEGPDCARPCTPVPRASLPVLPFAEVASTGTPLVAFDPQPEINTAPNPKERRYPHRSNQQLKSNSQKYSSHRPQPSIPKSYQDHHLPRFAYNFRTLPRARTLPAKGMSQLRSYFLQLPTTILRLICRPVKKPRSQTYAPGDRRP